jgi:hypothetical protein
MKKIGIVSVLCMLAVGMWATGCGSSGTACTEKTGTTQVCVTYSGGDSSDYGTACTAAGGTTSSSCPTANALGTCALTEAGVSETETYYSGGALTASTAQSACTESGGKWTAS